MFGVYEKNEKWLNMKNQRFVMRLSEITSLRHDYKDAQEKARQKFSVNNRSDDEEQTIAAYREYDFRDINNELRGLDYEPQEIPKDQMLSKMHQNEIEF
jgi:hypothetical protein